jgi:ATP/maltotriose-dependent transcriptional regulator MalT
VRTREGLLADPAAPLNGAHSAHSAHNVLAILANDRLIEPSRSQVTGHGPESGGHTGTNGTSAAEPRLHCTSCERPLWTWLIRALAAADHFQEAAAACAVVKHESERLGAIWRESLWHCECAELLFDVGHLDEALAQAEAGLRPTGHPAYEDYIPAHTVLARISVHRGDVAAAGEHLLRVAERLANDGTAADKVDLNWSLALFYAASGRPNTAVQKLVDVEEHAGPEALLLANRPTAAAALVRLARDTGLDAEAERAADVARRITERNPAVASLAGGVDHAEGLLHRDPAALRRAVEYYRLSGRPLATGIALEDVARHEHEARNKAQAARHLESALDLYKHCGARRDAARVQKELRRLGAHDVRDSDRPKSGWGSVTSAELRVVRAIVDGKTNREAASTLFLSPHTVDSHLRHVFAKLNINTRVELTKQFIAHEDSLPVPMDADKTG